jgi:flagellin-like hook-associated protein FlgL
MTQRVKIGSKISSVVQLQSGVRQGGILSPMIFMVYGADVKHWLEHARAFTYADDTSTSAEDKDTKTVLEKLEEDVKNILKFMASNGLVANPSKTVFMMLGKK